MPITAVAFDVMDTLLVDPFREALQAATGLPPEELFRRRDPDAYPRFERGEISEAEYWASYRRGGVVVDTEVFHTVRRQGYRWVDGMAALLDELAGRVQRIAATNYPWWIREVVDGWLAGRVELVVASCDLGVRKPEPAFYAALLDRAGVAPAELAFVDDRPANVEAAAACGIAAHRFTSVEELRRWLADLGVC